MNSMLVSIITPTYNSEKYIEQCIMSIRKQNYKHVEHIIQDGGSTDKTLQIIQKYEAFVKLETGKDLGPADALNKAFKRCKGDILLVLNSDDILLPFACKWAVKKFEKYSQYAVIYGNQDIIDEEGRFLYKRYGDPYNFEKQFCVENVIPAQTAFVQRKFFQEVGLSVDPLTHLPDYDMWVKLGLRFEMKYFSKLLCKFRRHPDQISLSVEKILNARFDIMNKVFQLSDTPENIKQLKQRAYAGNYHWAAVESFGISDKKNAVNYLLKAYELVPEYKRNYPLISVITPSKNAVSYIEDCIKSVAAQSYKYVEHIIQDGNSKDGTTEIISRYNHVVDCVSEDDMGESDGLDKALKRANGEIILVLNSDDILLSNACMLAKFFFTRYPDVAVIYGNQFNISENNTIKSVSIGPNPYSFAKIFCVEEVIPAQTAFIKCDFFNQVGFYADKSLKICPDYEIWVRLGLNYQMKHINYFLCKYRWHPHSAGRQSTLIDEMIQAKTQVIQRILNEPSMPDDIRNLKQRAFGGVYFWAGICFLSIHNYREAFSYFKLSRKYYPIYRKVIYLFYKKFLKSLYIVKHVLFLVLVRCTLQYRLKYGLTKEKFENFVKYFI